MLSVFPFILRCSVGKCKGVTSKEGNEPELLNTEYSVNTHLMYCIGYKSGNVQANGATEGWLCRSVLSAKKFYFIQGFSVKELIF